jgi:hypothetical protein
MPMGLVQEAKNIEKVREILKLDKGVSEDDFGYISIEKRFCETSYKESLVHRIR